MTATVIQCPHCGEGLEVEHAGEASCPHCRGLIAVGAESFPPPVLPKRKIAAVKTASRGFGWWSLLKPLGLLAMIPSAFVFVTSLSAGVSPAVLLIPIAGFAFGALLYALGGAAQTTHICGACGNSVQKQSRLCPTCRIELQ